MAVLCLPLLAEPGRAQESEGDQFLDGIGETALVARYLLDGDVQDWSRNDLHATQRGGNARFIEDEQFGRVLELGDGAWLEVPGSALAGADNVSVTGWVYLESDDAWQRFFDFGRDATANFFCTPVGDSEDGGFRARITASGWNNEQGPTAPRIARGRWVHLAVVLDADRRTLSIYADGRRVGRAADVSVLLTEVLDAENPEANHLYFGRSHHEGDPTLRGRMHDLRIYQITLTDQQVVTVRNNALPEGAVDTTDAQETQEEGTTDMTADGDLFPFASEIESVPDITVSTLVGHLPNLPPMIPAVYQGGKPGPDVRVIWPAPRDNSQVREPGTYTVTGIVPGTYFVPKATIHVQDASILPVPEMRLTAFPLGQVVLDQDEQQRDTKFIQNRDKFLRVLAETNPDRFLYMFRNAFGQQQPEGAEPLHGWDSQTTRLRGHATGHYLTAIAQAYAGTGYDPDLQAKFEQKMNYMIDTLYGLSQLSGRPAEEGGPYVADPTAVPPGPGREGCDSDLSEEGIRTDYWNWGVGFISAYPPDQFIMLEQGATYGGSNNQIWAPYYTLHKILAGLLDCYEVGGNEKALEIGPGMGRWVHARLSQLPDETRIAMWNRYIAGEYGGMNEVMARLYRITGEHEFLECARLFDNIDFFFGNADREHGLARNVDTIRGKHANQHILQITGALETFRNTGELDYFLVARNFFDMTRTGYMYSIGGVAGATNPNNAECFTAEPNTLFQNGFARGGQNETCATYNLLKLSRMLFMFEPDARYMDYYEQALYNHILASVVEHSPGNTYHVPLNPGARKQFGNAEMDGFTCCNGTAIESSTKLQDTIYLKAIDDSALYVNLYVPSTLTWPERNVVVRQVTNFPHDDTTRLTIGGSGRFDLHVRVPRWATKGFFVTINGEEHAVETTPGSYLKLSREWHDGDTIELRMPFDFYLERVMDQPNIASIF